MLDDGRLFAVMIAFTVTPKRVAMALSVSPPCTVYFVSAKAKPTVEAIDTMARRRVRAPAAAYLPHARRLPKWRN